MDAGRIAHLAVQLSLSLTHIHFFLSHTHTFSVSHTHTHSPSLSHTHTHSLSHTHTLSLDSTSRELRNAFEDGAVGVFAREVQEVEPS